MAVKKARRDIGCPQVRIPIILNTQPTIINFL
jgi:hypothetical protein